ncbi:MAG: hypothetical protein KDH88_19585 [Chromatiales bacterium]|nr:hypothetical protein [Chromatiales bacterium]
MRTSTPRWMDVRASYRSVPVMQVGIVRMGMNQHLMTVDILCRSMTCSQTPSAIDIAAHQNKDGIRHRGQAVHLQEHCIMLRLGGSRSRT